MNEKRNNGLDLLKTICIVYIVLHHILLRITDMRALSLNSFDLSYWFCLFINSFLVVAVNCFFLISGYFRIKHNNIKMIRLIIEIYFIYFFINLIFFAFGEQEFSLSLIKDCAFPLSKFWFILVYIVLDFISPYINKMLETVSIKEKQKLIIFLAIVYCGYAFLTDNAIFGINRGYSIAFAIFIYIVGDYIRGVSTKQIGCVKPLCAYFALCIINGVLAYLSAISRLGKTTWLLFSYNNPLVILASICLFLALLNCGIRDNLFSMVGRYTLYIYVIHSTPIFIDHLINVIDKVWIIKADTVLGLTVLIFVSIVTVFLCCIAGYFISLLSKAILVKLKLKGSHL